MASNQTQHLKLSQWEADDEVLRSDFNADNAKIDAAVGELAGTCGQLTARCGNCVVVTGSYVGTGNVGEEHPCKLTFPYKPMLVLLPNDFILRQGSSSVTFYNGVTNPRLSVSWEGNSVSWYIAYGSDLYQCNIAGNTYRYTAFLAQEEDPGVGTFTVA